ncbi:MAG TPA: MFS transporter [Blastocatellia bacterium]|nr:MFS transporter [Blastocatellia bacterium]
MTNRAKVGFALAVLFAINTMNFFDRQILGAVGEMVRTDWGLNDTALGALGTAFTLLYAAVGLPLGRLTDKAQRTRILSVGVFVWTLLTAASGLAANYWQLFVMRLGVGVGEATCAPASTSLIGDLFPASWRAKALSIFMLGLPLGIALSYAVSGTVAQSWGWRSAFYVAGIPGLICVVAALFIHEPKRGATEIHNIGASRREGPKNGWMYLMGVWAITGIVYAAVLGIDMSSLRGQVAVPTWVALGALCVAFRRPISKWAEPFLVVLSIPTMWWLILSGALHNFNMYAIGSFLSPFLIRYHILPFLIRLIPVEEQTKQALEEATRQATMQAGFVSMFVNGLAGVPGLILGGIIGDAIMRRRANGRLLVGATAILLSAPLHYFGLRQPAGSMIAFAVLMGLGVAAMYVYYSTVYSTIQDVIEPSLRGTGMALYFFAMYVLGASFGPVGTGLASDYFTKQAAIADGVTEFTRQTLEPYRADGLHSAMFLIPVLGGLLMLVLFAGSRTVTKDMDKLHHWMRRSTAQPAAAVAQVESRD